MATKKNIHAEVITITPAMAKKFLLKNANMRKPSLGWVKDLAREMKRGQWELNGEAIKFNSRGNLIDGQHRLMAIVRSGVSIECLVVTGSFSDLRLDMGKRRKFGDVLRGEGEVNCNEKASATRLIFAYENQDMVSKKYTSNIDLLKTFKRYKADFAKHDELRSHKGVGLPFSHVFGFWIIFRTIDKQNANCFLECMLLKGNYDLDPDDPMLWVRNRFIQDKMEDQAKGHLATIHKQALVIKAWNMWWEDRLLPRSGIVFARIGPSKEKFPVIRGGKWDPNK